METLKKALDSVPFASDEESEEIKGILNSMTEEEKEIGDSDIID